MIANKLLLNFFYVFTLSIFFACGGSEKQASKTMTGSWHLESFSLENDITVFNKSLKTILEEESFLKNSTLALLGRDSQLKYLASMLTLKNMDRFELKITSNTISYYYDDEQKFSTQYRIEKDGKLFFKASAGEEYFSKLFLTHTNNNLTIRGPFKIKGQENSIYIYLTNI